VINLEEANAIIAGTIAKGCDLSLKPLTVAVVDAGGWLVAFQRANGSPNLRPAIAIGKAAGARGLGVSSGRIGTMALERPHFVEAIQPMAPQGLVPVAGGLNIVDATGRLVGAVGVSGDTSDNDEICAKAGILAAGLTPQE